MLYTTMKASGGFIWAPADVLNLKWSENEALQIRGDQPLTLGMSYAFVGIGCIFGPLLSNKFLGNEQGELITVVVISIGSLGVGYLFWTFASSVWTVYLGNLFRSAASAAIWIKSTILLQLYTDQKYLGRIFAVEMAFYTMANSFSMFSSGVMLDYDVISEKQTCTLLVGVSIVVCILWVGVKRMLKDRRESASSGSSAVAYERVKIDDDL